jgi:hypothetical protein
MRATSWLAALALFVAVACGDVEEAGEPGRAPTPAATSAAAPSDADGSGWLSVDRESRAATIEILAGDGEENDGWNFNGHAHGDMTVVVPLAHDITIHFSNDDPVNRHSLAVLAPPERGFPIAFDRVEPAFEGAATTMATSTTESTARGESESITFHVDRTGSFALVCLVPAHAATGMWIGFEVSEDDWGVR